jgi:uncharacterized protein YecE (DUF72 family)
MGRRTAKVFIGTSGWNYKHWKPAFYPAGVPACDYLSFYVRQFSSVEVNKSFYRLLKPAETKAWYSATPPQFLFSLKGSRFITHMLKLKAPRAALRRYFSPLRHLGVKKGPILFQLPPRWDKNVERFSDFVSYLPAGGRYAFEFRDPRWIADDVVAILRKKRLAFCIYDLNGYRSPRLVTAPFVYIRLHGPGRPYQGSYKEAELGNWLKFIRDQTRQGRDVYCYFDNDQKAYAVQNALRLQERLSGS